MSGDNPFLLAAAIWGHGARVKGRCCKSMKLTTVDHPLYCCESCGKTVKLVKRVTIQVKVIE